MTGSLSRTSPITVSKEYKPRGSKATEPKVFMDLFISIYINELTFLMCVLCARHGARHWIYKEKQEPICVQTAFKSNIGEIHGHLWEGRSLKLRT